MDANLPGRCATVSRPSAGHLPGRFPRVLVALIFGLLSVATMIPLQFDDKRTAMTGAFLNRFAIGVVIGAATLPVAR